MREGWKRPYLAPLGRRLRGLRQGKGWSWDELASRAGLSRSQVRKLEAGFHPPRRVTLERLARVLEVDVSDLLELGIVRPLSGLGDVPSKRG